MEQNHPPDGYAPGYDEAAAFGDANADSIGISKITVDRILKMERPDHCLALYVFFCYTARWQRTAQAKCTVGYAAKAMGWSERVTQRAKAQLVKAGLVENIKHVDADTGQVKGWYIRVRHIVRLSIHPATDGRVVHPAKLPGGGDLAPKCLRTNKEKCLQRTSREVVEEKKSKGRATHEEVKTFFRELNLPQDDADWFYYKCEGNGWKNGGTSIKDWKLTVRSWVSAKYLPSLKANGRGQPYTPQPTKRIVSSAEMEAALMAEYGT